MIKIWLVNLFFYKCGDNDTSVATFVGTLIKMLDAADLDIGFLSFLYILFDGLLNLTQKVTSTIQNNCLNAYIL
jgi:hypothetical protein